MIRIAIMPNLAKPKECTGCQACVNVCLKSAITMKADQFGFLHPEVDSLKCISCQMCEKSCPEISGKKQLLNDQPSVYAVISRKDRDLSSSGGAFSVFARYVLARNGVVFGASIDDNLQVKHIFIESVDGLPSLRGSKYVQSFIGDSYKRVKSFLKANRMVLFSGTPCQVAGLYSYLGNNRYEDQLITLDLVCHGAPCQSFFDAYIAKLQREYCNGDKIDGFRFRKLDAWDYRPAYRKANENKWTVTRLEKDSFMKAFFKGLSYRESCYRCKYANMDRVGNFTIADFWGVGTHGMKFNHSIGSGVSAVIDNCNRMQSIRAELDQYAIIEERMLDEILTDNQNLKGAVARPNERNEAIKDMLDMNMSLSKYSKKYKLLPKNRIKYWICELFKTVVYSLNLYNFYKSISYRLK